MQKDYHSVLVRAISALDPASPESRQALYNRARDAMANAPLTPSEIERERFALERAIRKIESNLRHPGTGVSPPYSGAAIERFDEGAAPPPDVVTPPRPVRKSARLLISALAVVAILAAGFAGNRYWAGSRAGDIKTRVQAPMRDMRQVASAEGADEKSNSYILKRQMVYYRSVHPVGTIVISKSQNFLYLIKPNTAAMRYTIGIGRECSDVVGLLLVSAKEDWTRGEPQATQNAAPATVRSTTTGQFGARSLALSDTGHRIHGSSEPVARRAAGCFPLVNEDVVDLYEQVPVGTRVVTN